MNSQINNIINLRGMHEEAKFAYNNTHKGHKGLLTKGCVVITPMIHALKGSELDAALQFRRWYSGEDKINVEYAEFLLYWEGRKQEFRVQTCNGQPEVIKVVNGIAQEIVYGEVQPITTQVAERCAKAWNAQESAEYAYNEMIGQAHAESFHP